MPRPKGAVNLPKVEFVPLEAIMIGRTPDALIPVDRDFAKAVMLVYNATKNGQDLTADVLNQIEEDEEDNDLAGMEIKYFGKKGEET